MKVLLDTVTFLWLTIDAPELSSRSKEVFTDPDHEIYLSAVSALEITVKYSLGKLPLPELPHRFVSTWRQRHGILPLPLDEESATHIARLPDLHRDPFDRLLVSQSIVHGLAILTPDRLISQYPARVIW